MQPPPGGGEVLDMKQKSRPCERKVGVSVFGVCLISMVLIALVVTPSSADSGSSGANSQEASALRVLAQMESPGSVVADGAKRVSASSRLLLPYFRVDTTNGAGDTTLYAIRNETLGSITVDIQYFEADSPQAPQRTDQVNLGPKQIHPVNVRDVANLEVDGQGIAEGYVFFSVMDGESVLSGDYFQVTPGDAFATGERMIDADPLSSQSGLCGTFSTRFLSGGAFSGGTTLTFWFEAETLPVDPSTISYTLYGESGDVILTSDLPVDQVAGQVTVETLLGPFNANAGAVEIQFSGRVGYVSATLSASGLFSVGLDAVCRD